MKAETELVERLLALAKTAPVAELAHLLGALEEIRVTALARLTAPLPAHQPQQNELLNADQAAPLLGMSKDYLYKNADRLPFSVRIDRAVRFSASGIRDFVEKKKSKSLH